jgi:hypothetical protein
VRRQDAIVQPDAAPENVTESLYFASFAP